MVDATRISLAADLAKAGRPDRCLRTCPAVILGGHSFCSCGRCPVCLSVGPVYQTSLMTRRGSAVARTVPLPPEPTTPWVRREPVCVRNQSSRSKTHTVECVVVHVSRTGPRRLVQFTCLVLFGGASLFPSVRNPWRLPWPGQCPMETPPFPSPPSPDTHPSSCPICTTHERISRPRRSSSSVYMNGRSRPPRRTSAYVSRAIRTNGWVWVDRWDTSSTGPPAGLYDDDPDTQWPGARLSYVPVRPTVGENPAPAARRPPGRQRAYAGLPATGSLYTTFGRKSGVR